MKKTILALAVAALPVAAFADVTVYGKANVSVQQADEGDYSQIELVSNASRIGLKGGEDLGNGLKAIYQFEYQTNVDDGNGGKFSSTATDSNGDTVTVKGNQTFGQRNIYVGLQGSGGTVMAGMFDTPMKSAQEKVDLFNDLEGDIAFLVKGDTRAKNVVQYVTPSSWGSMVANVAYVAAEKDGDNDGVSASLAYSTSALYLALAAEQDVTAQDLQILRLVGRYTTGPVQLGALYEQAKQDTGTTDSTRDSWVVSAKYNLDNGLALKAQYGDRSEDNMAVGDGTSTSVGFDYSLSKNAMLFGYYTNEDSDIATSDSWVGVGVELKF